MARGELLRVAMIDSSVEIELARHQWADGERALRRAGTDPAVSASLARQVEVVSGEIARRLGQVFTLAELVGVYRGADRWALGVIHDALGDELRSQSTAAADAAFDSYARRASDYVP